MHFWGHSSQWAVIDVAKWSNYWWINHQCMRNSSCESQAVWIKTCLNHAMNLAMFWRSLRNWRNAETITATCTSANESGCIQASERVLCTYTNALLQSSALFGWRIIMLSVIYHYWINLSIWAFFRTISWAVFIKLLSDC